MKKIDYYTYLLSDGSVANIFHDETKVWLNKKYWKQGKITLLMPRTQSIAVLSEIDSIILSQLTTSI
jgi:hypothetical protein